MSLSMPFIRILFLALCVLISSSLTLQQTAPHTTILTFIFGIFCGLFVGGVIISFEIFFQKLNLRTFNVATLGLFFGVLMGEAVMQITQGVFSVTLLEISPVLFALTKTGIFLFTCYMGMMLALRASNEIYMSIPFVKFKSTIQKKKDLIVDTSALADTRLLDLAATGLVDQQLIIPNFIMKELQDLVDNNEESLRLKARRGLEAIKKLESTPGLDLRFSEVCPIDSKDTINQLTRIARLLEANILTADMTRSTQDILDGVRIINLNALSTSLKPLSQTGEILNIKIQRYGKEPRQGVGYLDDGTMVVVNGAAEFIGDSIRALVLSVKQTSSGRMIFCNSMEEDLSTESLETSETASNYFAL